MRHLLYFLTLLFLISCSKDVDELKEISPGLEWSINIGYSEFNYIKTPQGMASTTDNGFFVIETDTLEKHNNLGGFELTTTVTANKVIKTDNGFLIYKNSPSRIISLSDNLSVDWEFSLNDNVNYLLATNDSYLLTHSSSKVGITKLSLAGEVVWQKNIDEEHSRLNAIQKTTNGFIAIGYKPSTDIGKDTWIVRLDDSGSIIWEKTYENNKTNDATGINIYQLDNGNFLALSSTTDIDYDASSIIVLDDKGEIINENQLENTYFKSLIQTNDGDFIAVGSGYFRYREIPTPVPYYSTPTSNLAIATKINQEGKRIWQIEKFIGDYDNMAHSAIETKDNGIIVMAGGSDYYGDNLLDIFKINPEN